MYGFASLAEVL